MNTMQKLTNAVLVSLLLLGCLAAQAETVDYTYDDLGRLTAVGGDPDGDGIYSAGPAVSYEYDAAGNILSKTVAEPTGDTDNCPAVSNPDQADGDNDDIGNACDNCTAAANTDQRDTDNDGCGNVCDADLNNDCAVDLLDLASFRSAFLTSPGTAGWNVHADLNIDEAIDLLDLALVRAMFLTPPGPSANTCQ